MKKISTLICALMILMSASAAGKDARSMELKHRQHVMREAMIRNNGQLPVQAKAPQLKNEVINLTISDKPYVSYNDYGTPQVYISMTSDENYGITIYINGILEMVNGKTYTYADMDPWSSVGNYNTYQYSGLNDAAITWTKDAEGLERYEGFVSDTLGNTYNFLYQEVPFVPTGDTIQVRYSKVGSFDFSSWNGYWSINGYDNYGSGNPYSVYFALNTGSESIIAGHYTEADFADPEYNHIYVEQKDKPSKDYKFMTADINIINRNDSLLLFANVLAEDGNVYDIYIYYSDPRPIYHKNIVANMTVDTTGMQWGSVSFKGANKDFEVNISAWIPDSVKDYHMTYDYGQCYPSIYDMNDSTYITLFSGTITITKGENGDILTAKLLGWNDTEYELYMTEGLPEKTRDEVLILTEGEAEISIYKDLHKFVIWGCNADSSRVVSISVFSDEVTGVYTINSIDLNNSYIAYDMNEHGYIKDKFSILDANITVQYDSETGEAVLAGTILAQSDYYVADVPEFTLLIKAQPDSQPGEQTVPSDAVLADYYQQGNVCVCFYVPSEMYCNNIVLTGSFNGWSTNPSECVTAVPVQGYNGWYVASFEPVVEPNAPERGIQAKPVMLDIMGNFNWEYQISAATVIRGDVQIIAGIPGEIDLINYGIDAPNVFMVDAWKKDPCSVVYRDYTITVISDGCNGNVIPFLVGSMTNWNFQQMELDINKTMDYQVPTYSFSFSTPEGGEYQIVSAMMDPETDMVDETQAPGWYNEAYMLKRVNGVWTRIEGEAGMNQTLNAGTNIVWDLRADTLCWARCEPEEYVLLAVKLPEYNCPQNIEVIGDFDGWTGTAMERLETGWYFTTLHAKSSQYFKFRGAGDWAQYLEIYVAEYDEWEPLNDLSFGALWTEDSYKGEPCKWIELDFTDTNYFRWHSENMDVVINGIKYHLDVASLTASVIANDYSYSGNITIPAQVSYQEKTYNVVSIESEAFAYCIGLTAVTIPNSISSIGSRAFAYCPGLTAFEIPNTVINFGTAILNGCMELKSLKAPAAALTDYWNFPETMEYICISAGYVTPDVFYMISRNARTLKTLDLKATENTELAENAFSYCDHLQKILLPANLTYINYMALTQCIRLESVSIPAGVTEIGDRAFEDCRSLVAVEFAGNAVKRIGDWAFYNCHELANISIPEGVTEIGKAAFYGCTHIKAAYLPASLQSIGNNGFAGCAKMAKMSVDAVVPPTVGPKTFDYISVETPVYVPEESVEAYRSHPVWGQLNIIGANAPQGIENTQTSNAQYTKILRDGQILILRGEKVYTTFGQELK